MLRLFGIMFISIGILSLSSQGFGDDEASNRSCRKESNLNNCGDHSCSLNRGCNEVGASCDCSVIT